MKHYSQVDPHNSATLHFKTMAQAGCFVCSIAMLVEHHTHNPLATPRELDKFLDSHDGYMAKGDGLYWDKVTLWAREMGWVVHEMKKDEVTSWPYPIAVPSILEVETPRNTTHFVVCTNPFGGGEIVDPGVGAHNAMYPGGVTTLIHQKYKVKSVRYFV